MNRESLLHDVANGLTFDYHTFWGGPFSQWEISPFEHQGDTYVTAEHFMMVQKARTFGDKEAERRMFSTDDPRAVKAVGRDVRVYSDPVWAARRYDAVLLGSFLKFTQSKEHYDVLMATGTQILVEASPDDRIWGVGWAPPDPRAKDPKKWDGENLLGFALTQVRDSLRRVQ